MLNRLLLFVRIANIFLVILTLLSFLSPYLNPQSFWVFNFLGLICPLLLLLNFLFLLFWVFLKRKHFLMSLLTLMIGYQPIISIVGFNFNKGISSKEDLKIMTFNVRNFVEVNKKPVVNISKFSNYITAHNTDIVCLQESFKGRGGVQKTHQILKSKGYNHLVQKRGLNTLIFSKYPIIEEGGNRFEKTGNSFLWADIKTPEGIIRVYNLHLQSNKVSKDTDVLIDEVDFQEKSTWRKIKNIVSKIKKATNKRVTQAEEVRKHIESSPHPVVVAGDLNDTPMSYNYSLLAEGLKDSFKEKGFGVGSTFAEFIPGLRIDVILSSPQFNVIDHQIISPTISDHHPVIATLRLKQ